MAGRPEPVSRERIAQIAERFFRCALGRRRVDDLGAQRLATEARVLLRLGSAQPVVHVERADAVAQRTEHVPEAGRVGPA